MSVTRTLSHIIGTPDSPVPITSGSDYPSGRIWTSLSDSERQYLVIRSQYSQAPLKDAPVLRVLFAVDVNGLVSSYEYKTFALDYSRGRTISTKVDLTDLCLGYKYISVNIQNGIGDASNFYVGLVTDTEVTIPPGTGEGTPSDTVTNEITYNQAPNAGEATTYARGDHTHGTPAAQTLPVAATTVAEELTFGLPSSVGASGAFAREDHTHGTPPEPTVVTVVGGTGITVTEDAGEYTVSLYVAPTVSLSGGSTVEKGRTIADVVLTWTCNKTMTTRVLGAPVPIGDRDRGAGGSDNYTHVGANIDMNSADKTYDITVGDGTNTDNDTTSLVFLNRRWYGTSANTALTPAEVVALKNTTSGGEEFASSVGNTHTFNCTGGRYIWICWPVSLGAPTDFKVDGFSSTFLLLDENGDELQQSVTNNYSYAEDYYCYRSMNLLNGSSIQVVVS